MVSSVLFAFSNVIRFELEFVDLRLGAHVSAAGGLHRAIDRAQAIGAEAVQIFASSPRSWSLKPIPEDHVILYREKSATSGIAPTFLHGIYLVGLGGNTDLLNKSMDSLSAHMNIAGQIGAVGVIFHIGSHKGKGFEAVLPQIVFALKEILDRSHPGVRLIIENSAGMGDHIGSSFVEIGNIIEAVDNDNLMVCLDTEHCFAAGYNLADPEEINGVIEEFDKEIGLSRLTVVHANDSKVECGGGIDRHENIGDGYIGINGFEVIMRHSAFEEIPFILEVPGFDKTGPDIRNLDILKEIRSGLKIPI